MDTLKNKKPKKDKINGNLINGNDAQENLLRKTKCKVIRKKEFKSTIKPHFKSIKFGKSLSLELTKNYMKILEHNNDKKLKNAVSLDTLKKVDVQSGVYEGGLKLWECATDLVKFLNQDKIAKEFKGKVVLELGCGHGVPGIFALKNGAKKVIFQDFNKEVLLVATLGNIRRNVAGFINEKFELLFGDWNKKQFVKKVKKLGIPDIILTSDTIYTPENETVIASLINKLLGKNGVAYVAAKRYYFGTDGSSLSFLARCKQSGLCFKIESSVINGRSSVRDIIKIFRSREDE